MPGCGIPATAGSTTSSPWRPARAWTPRRTASPLRTIRSFPSRSTTSKAWAWAAACWLSEADYADAYRPGHFWSHLARRRPRQQRPGGGRRRAALVAACRAASPAATAPSITGRSAPTPEPGSRTGAAPGAASHLRGLHRHGQSRDDRRPHHRGASALRRPVARSLWRRGWVEAAGPVSMPTGEWPFDDRERRTGYSVVLFVPHGRRFARSTPGVFNISRMPPVPGTSSFRLRTATPGCGIPAIAGSMTSSPSR